MKGDILTPLTIWGGFKIAHTPEAELIEERKNGDIIISKVKIDGRKTEKGQVKIYGVIARKEEYSVMPSVLVLSDFNHPLDEKTAIELAKRGYLALAIDLGGKAEDVKRYTEYPEDVSYANYELAKDKLYEIETDATETCWYEWCVAARYAAEYLDKQPCVNSIVGLGIAGGAGVLWQTVANNPLFYATAFAFNAGWKAHGRVYKYGGDTEPQFNDDVLMYVAGIDPQSYASHVSCPCLMLATTNSDEYDVDRAYDTVTRINENAYRAVNYSVGCADRVDEKAIEQISTFFGGFTRRSGERKSVLPEEPEIKCEIDGGKLVVDVKVDRNNLENVVIYVAEQVIKPSERTWIKVSENKKIGSGEYRFTYLPYNKSQIATIFAKATYRNGFDLCSNIIAKRFTEKDVLPSHKEKIIYTGRNEGAESVFGAVYAEDKQYVWHETDKNSVCVKKGPMSIDGVTASGGLITFKMSAEKYMPNDYAMLMLDLFVKQDSAFTVKLISDYHGNRVDYSCTQRVGGGKIWHNIMLEMSRFKTAEGRILKTYQNINAIEITADGDFILNNALWV